MRDNVYQALQSLESVMAICESRSMTNEQKSLAQCLVTLRDLSEMYFHENEEKPKEPTVGHSHKDVAVLASYLSREGLKARYPNLEANAIEIAINKITDIPVDIKSFVKAAEDVLKDVNDEIILKLLEF